MSPIKPADIQATIPSSTGTICEKLQALWSLATKLSTFWHYAFEADGSVSDDFKNDLNAAGVGVPVGGLVFWPLGAIPNGWLAANGAIVSRETYSALFGVYGILYGAGDGATTFQLPNLSDRFPLGYGTRTIGSIGGATEVELEGGNMPAQNLSVISPVNAILVAVGSGGSNSTPGGTGVDRLPVGEVFNPLGNADPDPVDIMNPYFVGAWIIKT
jgi:hypothetical protein